MAYKIVFSDIDGTLLNSKRILSDHTIKIVKNISEKLPFVLISARMPAAMRHLQDDLGIKHYPIIAYNGGLVLVDEKPISSTTIPLNIVEDLHNFNAEMDCHLSLYHNDEWYVPRQDKWSAREETNTKIAPEVKSNADVITKWKKEEKGAHKIMAMGAEENIDKIRDFLTDNYGDKLHLYRSKSTYLEIANKEISKFSAIQYLLKEHYGCDARDCIAFGDNYNDVEMVKGVGMGIAVANARNEVLEVAKVVTHPGTEDGVAKSLIDIFELKDF
ncbi:HAD family hydrolase [Autumnicola psychrophila]|uniref:HAD family hydrolase n=1 Tax=Autumnicola psychrophila TaxID=3075592 RepID=A0ABU3DSU1_9FLAO|nr:HAD family hydrolase [Zunongwangia sp. F225]MDT0686784.1 HAD family hydrolase [Zunongwangia sp. F225]